MNLLELFRTKNLAAELKLSEEGFVTKISEIGNLEYLPKCSVDLESKNLLANLTMWSSGECDLLVTDESAEEVLINETRILQSEDEVENYLEQAYGRLRFVNNRAS